MSDDCVRAKKEKKKDVLRVRANRRIQHLESPSRERKEPKKNGDKKTKFRPSRTPRAMKSKNMQTRYQLVQTYFINISTTNHRARAVRIHPSRAVFRKDEKFSESLYILGGNPKKSSSNARKQKAKERGISRSIHTRAIQTMLYHLSLSLSREADNHRRRQQKRMLCAYLCHFIFMSL